MFRPSGVTGAARALLRDRTLMESFRRDPDRALDAFGLSQQEKDAVRSGDPATLAAAGGNLRAIERAYRAPLYARRSLTGRLARRVAAVAVALGLPVTALIGSTIRARAARRARAIRRSSIRAFCARALRARAFRARALRRFGLRRGVIGKRAFRICGTGGGGGPVDLTG
jgi:aromatic-ring opening dioxygenase LigAB LigA subunit